MTHLTTRIICQEHEQLTAMFRSMLQLLSRHREEGTLPDFEALRAMLFYIDEFSEQRHHRRESELLFPKLRARAPLSRELFDRLDHDHGRGERRIRDLERALLGFEMLGQPRRRAFEEAVERYVDFYLAHMALEERELLPLAERVLSAADWAQLDATFTDSRDPLTGRPGDVKYHALFDHIAGRLAAVPVVLRAGS